MAGEWRHDDLVEDLAGALATPFVEVPLGSVYCQAGKVPRADVVVVRPSYTRFCLSVFEVKVNLADLHADLREGKWRRYVEHCHRLYFALPAELAARAGGLPAEAGLYVRGARGWSAIRGAPARELEIPAETLLALLFMRQRQPARYRRLDALRLAVGWHDRERTRRLVGRRAAQGLAAREELEAAAAGHRQAEAWFNRRREELERAAREALLGGRSWDSLWALCRAAGWEMCAAAEGQWPPRGGVTGGPETGGAGGPRDRAEEGLVGPAAP